MTFRGAVVGWTPTTEGARGRARCRKDSVLTAMLGGLDSWRSAGCGEEEGGRQSEKTCAPPRRLGWRDVLCGWKVGLPLIGRPDKLAREWAVTSTY